MTFLFLYRCRHCNGVFSPNVKSSYVDKLEAFLELNKARTDQSLFISMFASHDCSETSCGLGDLMGFKLLDEELPEGPIQD